MKVQLVKKLGCEFPVASQSRSPNNSERCRGYDTPFAALTAVENVLRLGHIR